MAKENGGAAFARTPWISPLNGECAPGHTGMSIRDYAAIEAMKGFMRGDCVLYLLSPSPELVAKAAYEMADAMLAERSKP